ANPGPPVYWDTSGESYGVYVTGGYAYLADWSSGLRVIDASCFAPHTYTAVAVDNCGNTSLPDSVSVLIDTVAPETSIATPLNGECINTSTVVVTGTVIDPIPSSGLDGVWVNGMTAEITGGTWVATFIGQPEGALTLIATATDAIGNSTDSTPVNITIDYTLPEVSITSPNNGVCINSTTVAVDGTVTENGSGLAVITVQAGIYTATGTNFPIALNIPVDGVYTINAWAEDNCGNVSDPDFRNITVDATPLSITLLNPTTGKDEGGDEVIIEGSGFAGIGPVNSISFGGVMVTGFTVVSDTQIAVTIPAVTVGFVDVVISDDCGNAFTCVSCFEYVPTVYYAVIVGEPSDVSISSITVAPNASFQVMIYGSVLINGEVSPDLGFGPESMGAYDFRLRHEVAYLTVNGISPTGVTVPDPGYEFVNPIGTWSNTDEGDGYATTSFNDINGATTTTPTGTDIPLAILHFTAEDSPGTTIIYISDVIDYKSNTTTTTYLDTVPRRALTVNIVPQDYAVTVGSLSSAAISSITVAPNSAFSVKIYGSVLINGEVSPTESMGSYDFRLRHEVAYLTINGISGSGEVFPDPGYEFDYPVGTWSNTDEGDGYATSPFNDSNGVSITTPTGTDIPLAVVHFSVGAAIGPTTIYISEVVTYSSNSIGVELDTTPRRAFRVNIVPEYYAVIVGATSGPAADTIIVPPSSDFNVMIYGSVLVDGEVSPDLGSGPESLGVYDFMLRHEVAYLTVNGITKTGIACPNPGCDFIDPQGGLSNTDEGDGYATSNFNDIKAPPYTLLPSVGADIPLAVLTFSTGTVIGPTTIYISEVTNYESINFVYLDTTPRRPLWIKVTGDLTPPVIQISLPENGDTVNEYRLVVRGTVSEPESWIESVTVNGIAADISALPNWTATLTGLPEGPLTIIAEAINGALLTDQDSVAVTVDQIVALSLMAEGKSVVIASLSASPTFTIDVLGSALIDGVLSGVGDESLGVLDFRVRHEVVNLNLVDIAGSGILSPTPGWEFNRLPVFTISNSDDGDGYATSSLNVENDSLLSLCNTPVGEDIPLARLIFSPVGTGTTTVYISEAVTYESCAFYEQLDKLPMREITVIITP
ncbi:MAG: IPT/TIG domain-containing protein, partial [Deltaproteobacteria bacterium]